MNGNAVLAERMIYAEARGFDPESAREVREALDRWLDSERERANEPEPSPARVHAHRYAAVAALVI
jgi:hypothetical protein